MLTKNIDAMKKEIARHIDADAVRGGHYWDGSTGCFIGCLTHSSDATKLANMYGVPEPLVRICESIFERLQEDQRPVFFREVGEAVGCDGKDLSRVHWAFLGDTLRHLPKTGAQGVVDTVIAGLDLLADGKLWPDAAAAKAAAEAAAWAAWAAAAVSTEAAAAAEAAARAARAAAEAAAAAAGAAAWAVARAVARADETYRQRVSLLALIAAAPVSGQTALNTEEEAK
jgi:hypothetical protein